MGLMGLGDNIEKNTKLLTEDAPSYLQMAIGGIVAFYWVLCLLGILAINTKRKCDDIMLIVLSSLALIAFVVLLGFELTLAVTISDFCYAGPDDSLMLAGEHLDLGVGNLDLLQYYTKCEGSNPMLELLQNSSEALMQFSVSLEDARAVCVNASITELQTMAQTSSDYFLSMA